MSLGEEPLSPIPEEFFEKYKAPTTSVNFTKSYNTAQILQYQTLLPFRFTTGSPVTMRNEFLDYLIRIFLGTQKTILRLNGYELLSNTDVAAIVRYAAKNVDTKLAYLHTTFQ